jgi:type I protein arginine methyltransferase
VAYAVDDFRRMYADPIRHRAMVSALEEVVTPGSTVIDLGCGTAMYGFHALALGAAHVFAIESDAPSLALGEQLAKQNGLADRMTFYSKMSFDVELPFRADVLIADLRDSVPFFRRNLDSVLDAKERLLKPGAKIVPLRDRAFVAPISAPSLRERFSSWTENEARIDPTPAIEFMANKFHYDHLEGSQLRAAPTPYGSIDYGVDHDGAKPVGWSGTTTIESSGTVDALGLWFESEFTDNVTMRSGPGGAQIYRTKQLPVFPAVEVVAGDQFDFSLRADFTGQGYRWFWSGCRSGERPIRRCGDLAVLVPTESSKAGGSNG